MEHARLTDTGEYAACPCLAVPDEVMVRVMEFLDPYDLCCVAQTCSRMNEISSCNIVWKRFCNNSLVLNEYGTDTWKSRYMSWLRPRLRDYVRFKDNHYITDLKEGPAILKILLAGDGGVGKSAIFNRFHHEQFNAVYQATIGVEFSTRTIDIQGNPVMLQVWDTAGQPRFRAIQMAYYRNSRGVMVVYDVTNRQSFENVREKWFPEIANYFDKPNILLVGVKKDLATQRQVTPEEGMALAREIGALSGWAEYSSRTETQEKAEELFRRLATTAIAMQSPFWPFDSYHVPSEELLQALLSKKQMQPEEGTEPQPFPRGHTPLGPALMDGCCSCVLF